VVGTVQALLAGGELLDAPQRAALQSETNDVLRSTAVVEDGLASWPSRAGESLVGPEAR
jgi:hypothetical protein